MSNGFHNRGINATITLVPLSKKRTPRLDSDASIERGFDLCWAAACMIHLFVGGQIKEDLVILSTCK